MKHLHWLIYCLAACDQVSDSAKQAPHQAARVGELRFCPTPRTGIVVGPDNIAGLPTNATLGELKTVCVAGDTTLYDEEVGWQTLAWRFPFVGAEVTAVQTRASTYDYVVDSVVPDRWSIKGDSIRLPDGALLPATLGGLRTKYGPVQSSGYRGGDDYEGPTAFTCRFPYLAFYMTDDGKPTVPDSARIVRVVLDRSDNTRGVNSPCATPTQQER